MKIVLLLGGVMLLAIMIGYLGVEVYEEYFKRRPR